MDIKAYKMDGLGNDFVIIDQRDKIIEFSKKEIIKICDRNFIGCDQLIVIKENNNKEIAFCTSSSILKSKILNNNNVETNIGVAKLEWNKIPISENRNTKNLGIKILDKNN